jgi:hypothetical protein
MDGDAYVKMLQAHRVIETLDSKYGKRRYWWQQDNAPPHRKGWRTDLSRLCESFGWPAYSPDLSLIEHMWPLVKKKLKGMRFADQNQLFKAVCEAWNAIELETVNSLVHSFPARCQVCIEVGGDYLNQHWARVGKVQGEMHLSVH